MTGAGAPEPLNLAVVTGADSNYFALLTDLLDSLDDCAGGRGFATCVLDLGLDEAQRDRLVARGARLAEPGWDFEFPDRAGLGSWFKAITARPFLPKHFPGYEMYLWIDSDVWVQDAEAIDVYLDAARDGRLAAAIQIDRCYQSHYKWQRPRFNTLTFREYRRAYGWRIANRLGRNPFVNSGAFALRADAPHWGLWQEALARGLQRSSSPLRDQTALNYVVFGDRAPTALLPAWCNWLCIDGPPMFDDARGCLVEPQPPHRALGMLHLAGPAKNKRFSTRTLAGGTIEAGLRYAEWRARRKNPSVAAAHG